MQDIVQIHILESLLAVHISNTGISVFVCLTFVKIKQSLKFGILLIFIRFVSVIKRNPFHVHTLQNVSKRQKKVKLKEQYCLFYSYT